MTRGAAEHVEVVFFSMKAFRHISRRAGEIIRLACRNQLADRVMPDIACPTGAQRREIAGLDRRQGSAQRFQRISHPGDSMSVIGIEFLQAQTYSKRLSQCISSRRW